MPFKTLPGSLTLTRGTRTAVVEHIEHIRGAFSGPARSTDTYYTVTGTDTTQPRTVFCPPSTLTYAEAKAVATHWVNEAA